MRTVKVVIALDSLAGTYFCSTEEVSDANKVIVCEALKLVVWSLTVESEDIAIGATVVAASCARSEHY